LNIKRKQVSNEQERKLLVSLITDTNFAKEIIPLLVEEHFLNRHSKILFRWIRDYFDQYEESPNKTISEIFSVEKAKLDEEDSEAIEIFLVKLNDIFESGINHDYFADQAERYIRERSLVLNAEKTLTLLKLNKLEEAEDNHHTFKKVTKIVSSCTDPLTPDEVVRFFSKDEDDYLVKFPGALGKITGGLKRSWFTVIQGAYKSNKSYFLNEIGNLGVKNRLKVLFINFEMSIPEMEERFYRSITSLPAVAGTYFLPRFDCGKNQRNSCKKPERTNLNPMFLNGVVQIRENISGRYKPCTYCRKRPDERHNYEMEILYKPVDKYSMTEQKVTKKIEAIKRVYGDCIRFQCYPRGSANVDDIKRQIDLLEYGSSWIPDILLVDYLQIMGSPKGSDGNEEQRVNDLALELAGLATERNILICTASQVKTQALKKKKLGMGDASQSARAIYGHPALVMGISGGGDEKEEGVVYCNVIAHRFQSHNPNVLVKVLQQLDWGHCILDSEFIEEE